MDLKITKENLLNKIDADIVALSQNKQLDYQKKLLQTIGTELLILEKITDLELKMKRIEAMDNRPVPTGVTPFNPMEAKHE